MSQAASPEVIITSFIHAIHPNFNYVVGITAFSGCLVTLLVVLFAFSTKESRRRLVFRLNVLAILLALTLGVLNAITSSNAILDPFHLVSLDVYTATIAFAVFPPLFYDSILLFRLFALYPPSITPKFTLMKIFAFPFLIKCGRLVVITLVLNDYVSSATSTAALVQHASATWFRNPYMTAEWSMQMADNLYSVSFFLYKLHVRTSNVKRARGLTERLRQIFYISIANFIFPLFFNIALIVSITTNRSPYTGTMLLMTNDYVTVIGVLCATIWFSGTDWVRTRNESSADLLYADKMGSGRGQLSDGQNGSGIRFADRSVTLRGTDTEPGSAMQSKQFSTIRNDDSSSVHAQNRGHSMV